MDKETIAAIALIAERLGASKSGVDRVTHALADRQCSDSRVLSFREAADVLGLTARWRDKTIKLWAKQGLLERVVPAGRKYAIGVTRESVDAFAADRNALFEQVKGGSCKTFVKWNARFYLEVVFDNAISFGRFGLPSREPLRSAALSL